MNRMKMISVLGLFIGLAALAIPSNASVVTSSASVAGVMLAAAPPSGQKTRVKACHLANDSSLNLCVNLLDGSTKKMVLCASAQGSSDTPGAAFAPNAGAIGGLESFLGEPLKFSNAFNVTSSTPSTSIALTCTYAYTQY